MSAASRRDGNAAAISPEAVRQRIIDLVGGATLELPARDRANEAVCRDLIAPGKPLYINFGPGDSPAGTIEAARQLQRAGFRPVPHIAARYLTGKVQLDEALAVAGDRDKPAGPFQSSLQLIESGAFEKHGITRIGIAGYPEGHPK